MTMAAGRPQVVSPHQMFEKTFAASPTGGGGGPGSIPGSGAADTEPRSSGYFPPQQPLPDKKLSNATESSNQPSSFQYTATASADPMHSTQPALSSSMNRGKFAEEWEATPRGSSIMDGINHAAHSGPRAHSFISGPGEETLLQRNNTLKKKPSTRRSGSLRRSGSRRSMKAGSVKSLVLQSTSDPDEAHSAFYCPVPTSANPTDALASRFQAWRKVLKDLITYFKEIQSHYEQRAKATAKLANASSNVRSNPSFLSSGGIGDALEILLAFNKQAYLEANKAREVEEEVIVALVGLRNDLQQKIKEIKNLSGDFKNSVDKEMDATRRCVKSLQDVLGQNEIDPSLTTGKQDPYLLRLAVDRQVERQIDEENYLHQAFLNLESSGRELESIVMGEIQKAYNAYASILKREADTALGTVDELRSGPIAMPKDHEWISFTRKSDQFVDPEVPMRSAEHIHYPGRDHVACQEIRAGLLERKSKYLKSYSAGWYVLSPTHLHEFKSADKAQAPVMSLYLPEQKLGPHSTEGASSNKFILKGRQTGTIHRGHTWVFRAESHDTMLAWYEDIKALTESAPQERNDFVRGHSRSLSQASQRSVSSDGGLENEEDDEPFSAGASAVDARSPGFKQDAINRRPKAGGRFPSDIQITAQRGLQAPLSPSSVSSGYAETSADHDGGPGAGTVGAAAAVVGTGALASGAAAYYASSRDHTATGSSTLPLPNSQHSGYGDSARTPLDEAPSRAAAITHQAYEEGVNPYTGTPLSANHDPINWTEHDHASHNLAREGVDSSGSPYFAVVGGGVGNHNAAGRPNNNFDDTTTTGEAPVSGSMVRSSPDAVELGAGSGLNTTLIAGGGLENRSGPSVNGIEPVERSLVDDTVHAANHDDPAGVDGAVRRASTLHIPGEYPRTPGAGVDEGAPMTNGSV